MSTHRAWSRVDWRRVITAHTLDDMTDKVWANQPTDDGDGPLSHLDKMDLSSVDTGHEMYGEVDFPLDFPDDFPEIPELTVFSMEHWLYLAGRGLAPAAPTELSPFPLPLHSPESYAENLRRWELTDDLGHPYPDLLELMHKLTTDYERAVWGTVRFPLRAHEREYVFDNESELWGVEPKQLIVPRVPFLITWSRGGEIISATSTEEGMNVNRRPAFDNYLHDFADEIKAILDPTGVWQPRSVPSIRVTREFADELAADPLVGSLASETGSPEWAEAVDRIARKHAVDRDSAIRLTELIGLQPAIIAEFVVTVHRSNGMECTPEETSGTLVFFADDEGGVVSIHSPYDSYGGRIVIYEPGTPEAVVRSLKAMFIDAANAS